MLREMAAAPASSSELAATVFHPVSATVGHKALPQTAALVPVGPDLRRILEQASGSSVTYLWGPPGTGKTFTIARLIAVLLEQGERVLVASHTHSAVDQALYAAVNADSVNPGPLANDPRVVKGQILRLGLTTNPKIPATVRLDEVATDGSRALADRIAKLEASAKPLSNKRTEAPRDPGRSLGPNPGPSGPPSGRPRIRQGRASNERAYWARRSRSLGLPDTTPSRS